MGKGRDWNVDLIPKFLMANGILRSLICMSHAALACDLDLSSFDEESMQSDTFFFLSFVAGLCILAYLVLYVEHLRKEHNSYLKYILVSAGTTSNT